MGTGSFPGVKRPGRCFDHLPAEVEGRVELYLYSPSGPSWLVIGRTLPLPLPLCEGAIDNMRMQGMEYFKMSSDLSDLSCMMYI